MKLYGSKRRDKVQCRYGCCGGKLVRLYKGTGQESAVRAARKRARQQGKKETTQDA